MFNLSFFWMEIWLSLLISLISLSLVYWLIWWYLIVKGWLKKEKRF